jgi:hypothetical protein
MLLSGDDTDMLTFEGTTVHDDTFLLLINAHYETIAFVLPGQEHLEWRLILDTATQPVSAQSRRGLLPVMILNLGGELVVCFNWSAAPKLRRAKNPGKNGASNFPAHSRGRTSKRDWSKRCVGNREAQLSASARLQPQTNLFIG